MEEVYSAIIEALDAADGQTGPAELTPDLPRDRYSTQSIQSVQPLQESEPLRTIAFVDGGNAEIVRAPHLSVQLVRVCGVIYAGTKRQETVRKEWTVLIRTKTGEHREDLRFEASTIPEGKTYSFDPTDRRLTMGLRRAEPAQIGGIVRRFLELELAGELDADAIVLDGNLEANYPGEEELLANARNRSGIILAGLAKRSSLLSSRGDSLLPAIERLAASQGSDGSWTARIAKGTTKGHLASLFAAKLNPSARHVFRVDVAQGATPQAVRQLFSSLRAHAREATFPGYPYGLILADRLARVSNEDKRYQRMALEGRLGERWKRLASAEHSLDAHDILDSM